MKALVRWQGDVSALAASRHSGDRQGLIQLTRKLAISENRNDKAGECAEKS